MKLNLENLTTVNPDVDEDLVQLYLAKRALKEAISLIHASDYERYQWKVKYFGGNP